MTKISLGGSAWLAESTAAWKAQQAQAASRQRQAANLHEPPRLGYEWGVERLYRKSQLDDDWIVADVLRGTAMRLYSDLYFANGRESEVQCGRLAAFKAATAALGAQYGPTVCRVVLMNESLQAAGEALGYTNRSAAIAAAKERLNTGLRRLAVWYGLLAPG